MQEADRLSEERQTCLPEAYKKRKEEAGANGWREAHNGAGGGQPLSVPGSNKQGLWGKERGCVFQGSKLGAYASCFVLQREEGKTSSPTLAMKAKATAKEKNF